MSLKNTFFLILTIFISACASTNTKDSSHSSLVIKEDIVFEKEALTLDKSKIITIYNNNTSTEIRFINDKKVPHPFIGKKFHKFVARPGKITLTVDYIGGFDGELPQYKAEVEPGRNYIFLTEEEESGETTFVYFFLFDIESEKRIKLTDNKK